MSFGNIWKSDLFGTTALTNALNLMEIPNYGYDSGQAPYSFAQVRIELLSLNIFRPAN